MTDTLNDCALEKAFNAFNSLAIRENSGFILNSNACVAAAISVYTSEVRRCEIPVINKAFGERVHPKVSKAYDKWVQANHDNPMIKGNCGFETFLAGWQTHEATKRESVAVSDIDAEIALAEGIQHIPDKYTYEEFGTPVLKYLKSIGLHITKIEDGKPS